MDDTRRLDRHKMVKDQLRKRGICDAAILAAFEQVPRHRFVPSHLREQAYEDGPLPIGHGQTISQPYIVALMLQYARVGRGDRTLEIGTGSGYQAALLASLGATVCTVERVAELAERASQLLQELGFDQIQVRVGDGTLGWAEQAPYQSILVSAGTPRIPDPLLQQLAPEGRLVIPVEEGYSQVLFTVTRTESGFHKTRGERCTFVPCIGRHAWHKDPRS